MKKILKLFVAIICFIMFTSFAKAGSLSLSGSTSAKVGSAVRVTVKISNLAGRFRVSSSDSSVLAGGAEDFWESSQTVTFTAKKAGKATITVTPVDVADYDSGDNFGASRSLTVNVSETAKKETIEINKTYSSNNYLSSLSVDGYEITPSFSKDKKDYELSLDSTVEKIMVRAKAEDENATVKGVGEVAVSEGTNTINITVVAENGNDRLYTIKAVVEDKNPIKVKVGKKKYTVVKNKDLLKAPENYTETTVKINDIEVPALTNEVTGYVLVGLKDFKGDISLYIYNPANGKYTLYKEMSFDSIRLQYIKAKNIPMGYKKYELKIDNDKLVVYKTNGKATYALIYGMNLSTGDIGWYSYDTKEHTLQRYNDADLRNLSVLNNKYLITIVILSVASLLLMLFIMILMLKIRNHRRS